MDVFDYINQWVSDNAFLLYIVYNAAVQALPKPELDDGKVYRWIYKMGHLLAANINVVNKPRKRVGVIRGRIK